MYEGRYNARGNVKGYFRGLINSPRQKLGVDPEFIEKVKMPNFKYTAKDNSGRAMTGFFEAADYAVAVDMLRKQGLIIVSVKEAGKMKISAMSFSKKRVKIDDLVIFSRQLATMVDAGIPLVGALDILGDQIENKTFGEIISKIRNDVETGSSLSEAIAKHKKSFSPLFVNSIKA